MTSRFIKSIERSLVCLSVYTKVDIRKKSRREIDETSLLAAREGGERGIGKRDEMQVDNEDTHG